MRPDSISDGSAPTHTQTRLTGHISHLFPWNIETDKTLFAETLYVYINVMISFFSLYVVCLCVFVRSQQENRSDIYLCVCFSCFFRLLLFLFQAIVLFYFTVSERNTILLICFLGCKHL